VYNTSLIEEQVSKYFEIKDFYMDKKSFYFVIPDYESKKFAQLIEDLDEVGYAPFLSRHDQDYKLNITKKPKSGKSNTYLNLVFFIATVATTIYAGYIYGGKNIISGIAFSAALLSIIGTHEIAHFFAARRHGVESTLPFFIPAPTLIGTFGAVINVKSPIPTRNALFDLGFSGPIAGIIVTIPVLIIGIYLSSITPMHKETIVFIPSLLMSIIAYFAYPSIPSGYVLNLHPIAFAGWVGIIITMLNLMPVAFLDGGHISRSIFTENAHRIISLIGVAITVALGWIPMALLMILILFMAKRHPGAMDNVSKLSKNRKRLAMIILVVFILCLSPIPSISV
jgi:membrane-associated protease RseP (regulator of RpoE activity)